MKKRKMIILIGDRSINGMSGIPCKGYRVRENENMIEFDRLGDEVWICEKRHAVGWRFGEGTQEVPPSGIAVVAKRLWRIA